MSIKNLYRKWSPTTKIFFYIGIASLFSAIFFGITNFVFKDTPAPVEYYMPEKPATANDDLQCKNEAWVVPTSNNGKAIHLGECDFSCREANFPEGTNRATLLFSLSPLWKKISSTKFQIISLPDILSVFIKNNQLNFEVIEQNRRVQFLVSDMVKNWQFNEWYDIAVEADNNTGLKLYIDQVLVTQKNIPDLDIKFDSHKLCIGSEDNRESQILIDNLLLTTEMAEDKLWNFKEQNENQQEKETYFIEILNRIKSFLGISNGD